MSVKEYVTHFEFPNQPKCFLRLANAYQRDVREPPSEICELFISELYLIDF